ncbi:hypothetical protein HMPREF2141_01028 [Bacteroides uniformis]|uniref:Uncharacterized protein n=1 Tax=Bacteroides uniformis (strain ATCC 8492 / DSM 6597 / CCUG 4942 / CIP 103695 / JCM 5828 / KCTC 5204 / NCTC 13054 / VPI 0061) TaxID=411479 RepID=A0ABC9N7R6_BACUC|nr:hypothetical protein BACUNI_03604 [Bacteroides uniformis ATCC 8492]EFA21778.1 hypothetical protein HMPREF0969_00973 [Bacteroides sp. D20]KXT37357.1 hypothetical protein HMPREF2141_01028 [Bacteroides uniformis]
MQTALHALQTPHKKSLFSRNGFSSFNYSQKQKTVNGTQFKMKKREVSRLPQFF